MVWMIAFLVLFAGQVHAGCGPDPDPCEIASGSYHIPMPEGQPQGTIMFLHGWGSNGKGSISNRRWVPQALAAGYAVVAPDGTKREGRNGRSWSFHPDWP